MKTPSKTISIHQPNYIPWLGYFYKIYRAETFVFHDDVQYSKRGMHNYHYIKSPEGLLRLKIPVEEKHGYKINEVRTRDELGWKSAHLNLIEKNYRNAKFFNEVFRDFALLLNVDYQNLAVMNREIITFFCNKLNFKISFVTASDLGLNTTKEEKVIDIVESLKGDIYYSGTGAIAYQKDENFNSRGIILRYSDFQIFKYPQLWGNFESNVSIIDFLMNCGYNWGIVIDGQLQATSDNTQP